MSDQPVRPTRGGSRRGALRSGAARLLLVLLGSVAVLVAGAGPASAHDVLLSTSPAAGSTVDQVPGSVVLTFDNPAIAMGTQLVVTGPSGPVQQGPARLIDNTVVQDLQGGAPAGDYTVQWRVTSIDGHPVGGTFAFTARAAGAGTPAPPEASTAATDGPTGAADTAVTGWVGWAVGLVVAVGIVVVAVVLVRRRRR